MMLFQIDTSLLDAFIVPFRRVERQIKDTSGAHAFEIPKIGSIQ